MILPTFRESVDEALEVAQRAEALGIDGVFCYDHIWPMGQPARPALAPFPVLGRLATTTTRLHLGPLVARVGLVPDDVLVAELATLDLLAPGRVIAALGVGDRLSAAENLAYGIPYAPATERLRSLRHCAAELRRRGITVWLGGRRNTMAIAADLGVAANLWEAGTDEVAARAAHGEVTWAGTVPPPAQPPNEPPNEPPTEPEPLAEPLRRLLDDLNDAGATWAVFAPPAPLELLARLARITGHRRG